MRVCWCRRLLRLPKEYDPVFEARDQLGDDSEHRRCQHKHECHTDRYLHESRLSGKPDIERDIDVGHGLLAVFARMMKSCRLGALQSDPQKLAR